MAGKRGVRASTQRAVDRTVGAGGDAAAGSGAGKSTAIVWFRRDFRLADHPALSAAVASHARVLPLYIHAPQEDAPWQPGAASDWWLHHTLVAFAQQLAALGSPLLLRRGDSLAELRLAIAASGATAVYWQRLYEPAARARDAAVRSALEADGIDVSSHAGALLVEPGEVATGAGKPYRVFTPFWRKVDARLELEAAPLAAPAMLAAADRAPQSLPIAELALLPTIAWDSGFHAAWIPGEAAAQARLEHFGDTTLEGYRHSRDRPGTDGTSALSPRLHFGELSPRQVLAALRVATSGGSAAVHADHAHFRREIVWREFSHHLLWHFPDSAERPMSPKFAAFPWRSRDAAHAELRAWQRGITGIPIVDAGMRQLWATGWLHNRVRMIAASFLVKNLLLPWQEGARWFWDTLIDASLAQNTLGWQWVAGSGADAAPYFRVFNPVLQGEKFDPAGDYVRRWLPELAKLPKRWLHRPWETPAALLDGAGIAADSVYRQPIVDLAASRDRALAAFRSLRTP